MHIIDSKDIAAEYENPVKDLPREKNVIIGDGVLESDYELFFGPLEEDDIFVTFPVDAKFQDIAVAFGIFKSKGQARKNGWGGDIPDGFWNKEKIGKLNHRITILKIVKED